MDQTNNKYKKILEAATKIFAQNGFHASRVSDIAREAGVASGTIYLYFQNKEDLIISIFKEAVEDLIEHVREHGDEKRVENALNVLVKGHLHGMESHHHRAVVFQIELRQVHPHMSNAISRPLKEYFSLMESILEKGREEGVFRRDIEIRLMRKMIFGTLDEICTRWVLSNCAYSLREMIPQVLELFLAALRRQE